MATCCLWQVVACGKLLLYDFWSGGCFTVDVSKPFFDPLFLIGEALVACCFLEWLRRHFLRHCSSGCLLFWWKAMSVQVPMLSTVCREPRALFCLLTFSCLMDGVTGWNLIGGSELCVLMVVYPMTLKDGLSYFFHCCCCHQSVFAMALVATYCIHWVFHFSQDTSGAETIRMNATPTCITFCSFN